VDPEQHRASTLAADKRVADVWVDTDEVVRLVGRPNFIARAARLPT
jgi:hypothetical protein